MGSADKIIRVLIAAIVAILFFTDIISGTLGIILLVLAGVFLLTSLVSFCPLYVPLDLKLVRQRKRSRLILLYKPSGNASKLIPVSFSCFKNLGLTGR
jgi:hypothetical protein